MLVVIRKHHGQMLIESAQHYLNVFKIKKIQNTYNDLFKISHVIGELILACEAPLYPVIAVVSSYTCTCAVSKS